MRLPWIIIGAALLLYGALRAPSGLVSAPYAPQQAPPELGKRVRSFQSRRWVRVEVPQGLKLDEFLRRYHLTARTYVCRQKCDGQDLKQDACAALSGALWVAAGLPEPDEGPACDEGATR